MTAPVRPSLITLSLLAFFSPVALAAAPVTLSGSHYRAVIEGGRFSYYSSRAKTPDMTYALASVRLGSQKVKIDSKPEVVSSADAVCCYHGDIISESYTALPHGVEQCWVVNDRPRSPGSILIEGRLRSPHEATSSLSGLSFRGERGRHVFNYGRARVVDQRNRACECAPELSDGKLTITIPASYVASAQFPILVDPVVGPELPVCPVFGSAPGVQENTEVAAGSGGALAVWQDARGSDLNIFATRTDQTGAALDPAGIAICTAPGDQTDAAAAWNGREYLVVWSDRRAVGLQHIYGARVRPTGEVIDKQGLLLSGSAGSQAYPRVASDGSGWLVVWQDAKSSSYDIYGCKVSADGAPGNIYGIATRSDNEESPDVAYNGSNFVVIWRDARNNATTGADIYGCRVAKNGVRLASDILVSCDATGLVGAPDAQRSARICAFGSTCFVVWEDCRNDPSNADIYGTRLSSTGSVTDKGGIALCRTSGDEQMPAVGYNGSKLLVTWRDHSSLIVKGQRLTTAGALVSPNGISLSSVQAGSSGTSVCALNSVFIVGWASLDLSDSQAMVSLLNDSGSVASLGTIMSKSLADQRDYSVADNGSEYAVVWSQLVNGSWDILGARISHAGQLLTPTAVNITQSFPGNQKEPSIAWNGSKYLVVWSDDSGFDYTAWDIKGCRLQSNLTKIDAAPLSVCGYIENQGAAHVASNRNNFLVVWEDSRLAVSPYYYTDLYGAVVDTNGTVTPTASAVSGYTGDQRKPRIASDNSNYFVVWEDYRADYPAIYGARVTSTGTVQDANGIKLPATSYYQLTPHICYGAGNYFVTWSDYTRISGCRITTAGGILDTAGITISTGSALKSCPSAWCDGTKYQVVWEDYRSAYAGNADVYHTTVSSTGQVSPYPETALASDLVATLKPRIFSDGSSGLLLYSKYDNFTNGVCAAALSDQLPQEMSSIAQAKQQPVGAQVTLRGKTVTGAFSGFFYMQETNRASGIKVASTVHVNVGDIVDVTGAMSIADGERQISCNVLSALGVADQPPKPLGIRGDALGGAALNPYTPGITGAYGANNIGLLVTTWGKVTSLASGYFYIESKPMTVIKVKSGSLLQPVVGKLVAVTGDCACEAGSGAITRVILPRTQSDIRTLN